MIEETRAAEPSARGSGEERPARLVDAGPVEDFPEGRMRVVVLEEREIGILNWQGEWFATRNVCPHLGAPVCSGWIWPLLSQPSVMDADLTIEGGRPVLTCPWHNWEFDLRTGGAVTGKERLKNYPAVVEDGRVKVDLPARSARSGASE